MCMAASSETSSAAQTIALKHKFLRCDEAFD
jgi:hypothetical protein